MTNGARRKRVPQNGAAIREIRRREGLTISDLAQAIGVSDSHIRNIETNNKPARPEHLARIAQRLHCDLEAIRHPVDEAAESTRPSRPEPPATPPFQPSGSRLPPSSPSDVATAGGRANAAKQQTARSRATARTTPAKTAERRSA